MARKEQELEIIEFWRKNGIFEKSVTQRPEDKQYVFYDGPPFATGLPHYGHILGLTSKDLFPRYWTMKGYRVERRWGWDCHGLPIENIAERELGIKDKREIEEMGIAKFNEFCRSKVLYFADEWKKTVIRMGKWIDFDNSYKTMDNSYMESVWYAFKKLHDSGYIYEGKKVLLYCPHCQTPLANSEIAMDNSYRDVTEKSTTAKFKLKKHDDTYVLAWTTTPWTLIGNVALAVNEDLAYVKVKQGEEFYILGKGRLSELKGKFEVVEEFWGERLLGLEYEPLYYIPSEKRGHYIINGGTDVSEEEGTGVVHMAIYGEFDYAMIKKYDLPIVQHVGRNGKITHGPEELKDEWFKDADAKVLEDLEKRNLMYSSDDYTHAYPFCYRCDNPLFYNAVDSWFVDIQKVKEKLLERNEQISWYPPHIKHGWFKNNLESAPDWSISRNRFWATSIPVWKCETEGCRSAIVIGSVKELQVRAIEEVPDDLDLHRHITDSIHLRCSKCKGRMTRIPEVMDCWFESGSMPYGMKHYPFENQDWFKDNFPADFISEYIAQVRAWFYYMHVLAVLLFDRAPFKDVVVTGTILAEDGTKMSKSKNNFPDPAMIFEVYGADSLRFYLMQSALMRAEDLNFSENAVREVYRRVITLLDNVAKFYGLYGSDNDTVDDVSSANILDRWMVSRTNELIKETTSSLDSYDTSAACNQILSYIDDLSTWYVRRSRDRFKSEDANVRRNAVRTLAYCLHSVAKVSAPIIPFISEEVHQMMRKGCKRLPGSIHLDAWPDFDLGKLDEKLHREMKSARDIVSAALLEREKAKIPVRQPLSKLTVRTNTGLQKEMADIIADELNVKHVHFAKLPEPTDAMTIELDTEMTPELQREGVARELVRKINSCRKEMNLTISDRVSIEFRTDDGSVIDALDSLKAEIMKQVQADHMQAYDGLEEGKKISVNGAEVLVKLSVL